MKKTLLLSSIIAFGLNANSQITITDADLPNGGDTAMISLSNQFNLIDVSNTGANQIWDFSFLDPNSQRIDTFYNVSSSSALYQISFNNQFTAPDYKSDYYNKLVNNNLPTIPGGFVTLEKPVFFTKNSSSKSERVGMGIEVNGIELPVKADTIDVVYQFPMNFNDNWISNSYLYMDMNPTFNAIFKRHQKRDVDVDGWGQITTPFGTYDVVRVKSIIDYTDSIYIDLGFGGSWNQIPTPQDVEYTWWANNNKTPILKVITQAGVATTIEYRDNEVTDFTLIESNSLTFDFNIFPNPASDNISISLPNNSSTVEIIDVTGKVLYNHIAQDNTLKVNTTNWQSGLYIIKVTNSKSTATKSFVIK